MKFTKTLVYLEHEVKSFTVNDSQLAYLAHKLPYLKITKASTIDEVEKQISDTEIFITWQFKSHWYAKAKQLIAIFTPAAGNDWIERDCKFSLPIINGTFHGIIMAESVLAMMLSFNRRFSQLQKNQCAKEFDRNIESPTPLLRGQHVLIIGYGTIGKSIARMLKTFDCKITGLKRVINEFDKTFADQLITPEDLIEKIGDADHVITILPNNKTTDNIITPDHFKAMKRSAFFYNIGRGNCYKEFVITNAIEKGYIAGAALDVFEKEPLPRDSKLWELPNVFIMPHASAICKEYLDIYFEELIDIINSTMCPLGSVRGPV
jgi:D-2-hydroxyacid dehydrogenase (NADP+)